MSFTNTKLLTDHRRLLLSAIDTGILGPNPRGI